MPRDNGQNNKEEKKFFPINERIKIFMEAQGLNASEFSNIVDVQRSSFTHLFKHRNQVSLDIVMKIKKAYPKLNIDWLFYGTGPMLLDDSATECKTDDKQQKLKLESQSDTSTTSDNDKSKEKSNSDSQPEASATESKVNSQENQSQSAQQQEPVVTMPPVVIPPDPDSPEHIIIFYPDKTFVAYKERK